MHHLLTSMFQDCLRAALITYSSSCPVVAVLYNYSFLYDGCTKDTVIWLIFLIDVPLSWEWKKHYVIFSHFWITYSLPKGIVLPCASTTNPMAPTGYSHLTVIIIQVYDVALSDQKKIKLIGTMLVGIALLIVSQIRWTIGQTISPCWKHSDCKKSNERKSIEHGLMGSIGSIGIISDQDRLMLINNLLTNMD